MDLEELLFLNREVFGVENPKIRAFIGSVGLDFDIRYCNPENIFFYFGRGVDVDVYVGSSKCHVRDYCCLKDVAYSLSELGFVHVEFKLKYPRQYISVGSDQISWTIDKGVLKPEGVSLGGNMPYLWDVTDDVDYESLTRIQSQIRVYMLQYDFTNIMRI